MRRSDSSTTVPGVRSPEAMRSTMLAASSGVSVTGED